MTDRQQPWQLHPPKVDDVAVVVQTVRQRKKALSATLSQVADSDIEDLTVVTQRPLQTKQQNLVTALTALDFSGKEWGIRLEDDVLVNRHIIENVCAWPALSEDDFGCGWLYHSQLLHESQEGLARSAGGNLFRNRPDLVGCLGVVFYVPMIPFIVMGLRRCWNEVDGAQDRAISRAVWKRALRVYVHEPPLVNHDITQVSTLAPDRPVVPELHSAGSAFDPGWRIQG